MDIHPTEDQLERFLLHQCQEHELEQVETHILACESCVVRLESLEVDITATKLALREMQREQTEKAAAREHSRWRDWLTIPKLSFAGGIAALAVGVAVIPNYVQRSSPATELSLSAYRGTESSVTPANHRVHVRLNASDLAQGSLTAKLVDSRGSEIWNGTALNHNNEVDLQIPPIRQSGVYYLRLYSPAHADADGLLREYAFNVK